MKHVRLMLEYFHPWPNSAGFYLARDRGWYRDAGIDLEITVFDPARGDTLEHLARREVHFGVFPSNRLLVRRERGQPLIGIAAINHGGLETIQTLRSTGIRRPRDLAGRRLAFGPTPRGRAMVRHLISRDGGDPDAVIIIDNHGREFSVDHIAAGEIDATFGGYWCWDALFGTIPETERLTWRVDDLGAPAYHSYLLGSHEAWIEADPTLVRSFVAATQRGYFAALAEPHTAVAAMERVIPYFPTALIARSVDLVGTSWTHDGHWGVQRAELLGAYAEWLATHGVLGNASVWAKATTNDFLGTRSRPEAAAAAG